MSKSLFSFHRPEGVKSTTGIINGQTDGIINTNRLTYPWAYQIFRDMLKCTWFPEEVDFTQDKADYQELLADEARAFDIVTCSIQFNDSVQTNNLADNVNPWITAPEVNAAIARQTFEEALHSEAYKVMLESITSDVDRVYDLWRTDPELRAKNQHIGSIYEKYAEGANAGDIRSQICMIVANQILEGIYFMSSFLLYYSLARLGKMKGSAINIKFINRDEYNHLGLFLNIFREIYRENPEVFDDSLIDEIGDMFIDAMNMEIRFGKYVFNNQILGITNDQVEDYIKYLTYDRIKVMSTCLPREYRERLFGKLSLPVKEHPLKWVKDFEHVNDTKTDFFTSDSQNYTKAAITFDDI